MNSLHPAIAIRLSIVAALLGLTGCSSTAPRSDRFGEYYADYLSDLTVTYHVKTALLAEPEVNELRTQVAARNGEVRLCGFAAAPWQVQKMEQVALGVRGVTSVRSDVTVR